MAENEERIEIVRAESDTLTLSKKKLFEMNSLKAAELGVLIYLLSRMGDKPDAELNLLPVLYHFNQDAQIDVLYALDGLVRKGYINKSKELDEAINSHIGLQKQLTHNQKPN